MLELFVILSSLGTAKFLYERHQHYKKTFPDDLIAPVDRVSIGSEEKGD